MPCRRSLAAGLLVALVLGGCAADRPRFRMGSLPFPSVTALWDTADPSALGPHAADRTSAQVFDEKSRGTVYTCRAGFLDLAHVRLSADWTLFARDLILAGALAGDSEIRVSDGSSAEYSIELRRPADWDSRTPQARQAEARRAALRAGQQVAHMVMTWHEVSTWYSNAVVPVLSESRSSFTYDDMVAHAVGVRIAGEALRAVVAGEDPDFDTAMTRLLAAEFERLQALADAQTREAALAVEGRWWEDDECTKRQVETGFDGNVIVPWLVPDFAPCAGSEPQPQPLAWFDERPGSAEKPGLETHFRMRAQLVIGPAAEGKRAPARAPAGEGDWEEVRRFMTRWVDTVRDSMREQFGPQAFHP